MMVKWLARYARERVVSGSNLDATKNYFREFVVLKMVQYW